MTFDWFYIESCFRDAQQPDLGDKELWMDWYRTCWSHLESAGLLEVRSGLDIVRIKLRGMVLSWLACEFCEVAQRNEWAVLYWDCLRDAFELPDDGLLLVALTEAERIPLDSISDLSANRDEALWDSTSIVDDWSRVLSTLAISLATREREPVLNALRASFGGYTELFQSMYGPSIMGPDAVSCKRFELVDELEQLEADLLVAEGDSVRMEHNRLRAADIEKWLDDDDPTAIQKLILVDLNIASMDEPRYFDDGNSSHRNVTWEWVESGCPIWIAGT